MEGAPKVTAVQESADNTRVKTNPLKKVYLIAYNSILTCSWALVLMKALVHVSEKKSFVGLYEEVEFLLKVSQTAAVCEVSGI